MNKFIRKPKSEFGKGSDNIYEKFNLKENPFPYNPFIEPISDDPKRNGTIFSKEIRTKELTKFSESFLEKPLDGNHDRIGYLLESSFTGRGNGKSAFLVNLSRLINIDYGQDSSNDLNKTFAIYLKAKSGGENSKFWQISRDIIEQICHAKIIEDCLLIIRYKVLSENDMLSEIENELTSEEDFLKLLDNTWLTEKIEFSLFNRLINSKMRDFGISQSTIDLISYKHNQASDHISRFIASKPDSWHKKEINNLLFDELVRIFALADFNGAYILIDEFEKIADFQKPNERIEFAYELRQKILESSQQSGLGDFFTYIFTMHPGTQRLILEAWEKSGINARSPLPAEEVIEQSHVILFDDIKKEDIKNLISIYLLYYRIDEGLNQDNLLYPFTEDAVNFIAELAKYNAAKILKLSHISILRLAKENQDIIDQEFVTKLISSEYTNSGEKIDSPNFLDQETNAIANSLKDVRFKNEG